MPALSPRQLLTENKTSDGESQPAPPNPTATSNGSDANIAH